MSIVYQILLWLIIVHLACAGWILFLAGTLNEELGTFDYILIFTMAPEILIVYMICKVFSINMKGK